MNDIKVSIIIPVYNVEEYLEECLDSAVNQTLKDIEIICVNDGSTDNSLDILKKYERKYKNITIINQENKGLSGARNSGLKIAKGKYVYFFDSDDIIDINLCKECYEISETKELDILTFDASVFYDDNSLESIHKFNYSRKDILNEELMKGEDYYNYSYLNKVYKSSACIIFINRKFLCKNQLNFYEGILHEDELFTAKSIILADKVSYIGKDFFKRRVRQNSIMTKQKGYKNAIGYYTVANELYKFYEKNLNNINQSTKSNLLKHISQIYSNSYNLSINLTNKQLKYEIIQSIKSKKDIYNIRNIKLLIKVKFPYILHIYNIYKNLNKK